MLLQIDGKHEIAAAEPADRLLGAAEERGHLFRVRAARDRVLAAVEHERRAAHRARSPADETHHPVQLANRAYVRAEETVLRLLAAARSFDSAGNEALDPLVAQAVRRLLGPVEVPVGLRHDVRERPQVPLERRHLGRQAGQAGERQDPRTADVGRDGGARRPRDAVRGRHEALDAGSNALVTSGRRWWRTRATAPKSSNGTNGMSCCWQWIASFEA